MQNLPAPHGFMTFLLIFFFAEKKEKMQFGKKTFAFIVISRIYLIVNKREAAPTVLAVLRAKHGMSAQHIELGRQNLEEQPTQKLFHIHDVCEKHTPLQALCW